MLALLDCSPLSKAPLAAARVRGARARQELLKSEGGTVSAAKLAKLLGVTPQAVDERRKRVRLLALDRGKHGFMYPVWQVGEDGRTLPGLEKVMAALHGHDPWGKLVFFLTKDPRLKGKRPLDALRIGQLNPVLLAAKTFGEHGSL